MRKLPTRYNRNERPVGKNSTFRCCHDAREHWEPGPEDRSPVERRRDQAGHAVPPPLPTIDPGEAHSLQ